MSGFLNKIDTALRDLARETEKAFEKGQEELEKFTTSTDTLWQENFGELNDSLITAYQCKAVSSDKLVKGFCFISYKYLCFTASKVEIPWTAVTNLVRAVAVPSNDPKALPLIHPLDDPFAKGNIYTKDGLLHQYLPHGPYHRTWNVFYHAWKAAPVFSGPPAYSTEEKFAEKSMEKSLGSEKVPEAHPFDVPPEVPLDTQLEAPLDPNVKTDYSSKTV